MPRPVILLLLAASAFGQEPDADPAPPLARRLADAIDLPGAAGRRAAARELARDQGVPLEAWLAAARALVPAEPGPPGTWTDEIALPQEGGRATAKLSMHVPASYDAATPAPLLLALHGAGGDGSTEVERWRGVADELGMLVLAPTDPGANEGYRFTAEERGAALAALRWARRHYNVDENRIHLTGISRGGHLAWDLGLRRAGRFASLAPMIGGPRLDPRQNNLRYLGNVAHLPIRDLQGEDDDPRMLFNLRLAFERLEALGAPDARLITFPGLGHAFDASAVDWAAFWKGARRDPHAESVTCCSAGVAGEEREAWVEILDVDHGVREEFTPRVAQAEWNALDDAGKRRLLAKQADEHTAHLTAKRVEAGRFTAEGDGVRRFRLLLDDSMFPAGEPVQVTWKGRTRTMHPKPDRRVLLEDFVERFDRTYVPVAELRLP